MGREVLTRKANKGKPKKQKAELNRSILDVGFGIIGNLLAYKTKEANSFVVHKNALGEDIPLVVTVSAR